MQTIKKFQIGRKCYPSNSKQTVLMSRQYLESAHKASFKNKESILRSEICGCFSCLETFPASEAYFVKETDGQETAWCPYCDTDAVLGNASGYPITQEFLKAMQDEWF